MSMESIKTDKLNEDARKPAVGAEGLFITAFSDGSYCPETRAWGVGIWVRDGEKPPITLSLGGIGYRKSSQAEERGLLEVVNFIKQHCDYKNRVVVIQCDSSGALQKMDTSALREAGLVKRKHVKGHTKHRNSRSSVNRKVDKLAGEQMNRYREIAKRQARELVAANQ